MDPILAVIEHYEGPDRDKALDWYRWLIFNIWGQIPDSLDGEELAMAPDGLREQIELYYAQPASAEEQ